MDVTFTQCRAAARAARGAEDGRRAIRVARPRSVHGLGSSRAPLALMLYVAATEGRLVWRNPASFALLERPAAIESPIGKGLRRRLLRIVDRRWDLLVFAVPPVLLLLAAVVAGLLARLPLTAVLLATGAAAYAVVFMAAQMLTQLAWVRRVLGLRQRSPDEIAEETLPGSNWSVPLLHHEAADDIRPLVQEIDQRLSRLVRADLRVRGELTDRDVQEIPVRELLIFLPRGATTQDARQAMSAIMAAPFGPGSRVLLRAPANQVAKVRQPVREGGGFFFFYAGACAVVLTICAYLVSMWEAERCLSGATCAGRPDTFGSAAHWLAWRLFFQDPAGISADAPQSLVIGWLTSVVGLVSVPVLVMSCRLAITAQRTATAFATEYLEGVMDTTRLLLITVTTEERDAVLAAVAAITGTSPERSFEQNHVIYDLGVAGGTRIGLVRCPSQGATGPGGAIMTTTEVIRRWRPDFVVMAGICYGLRDDWRTPQQIGDVIVSTAVFDLDRKAIFDGENGEVRQEIDGDRASAPSILVGRLDAASIDWNAARVYFGLMLCSGTLVDSKVYRDELRANHRKAVGGDMEGHGVYAAAAEARVPWIIVKGISDLGADRSGLVDRGLAARNAADFVAHAVKLGAFADKG
ncbi:nucleoside phosphorylase [Allocatelliglobosispora scoriae]|uniref:Nucleoside phosphorylase n=1 Tax=Allocatelliglobosispora scoriae TaxID=643052 RepID=A0A841C2U7_9ACTN|nr:hypothetical protein [Allocatelliglobosispora scoriae]MBB5873453.1 nucleoside phosphorylase [Allocatelliglobosispora scoriae]